VRPEGVRRGRAGAIVSSIVALVLLGVVVIVIGPAETGRAMRRAGPTAFLAVGGIQATIVLLQALAWGRICRADGLDLPFRTLACGTVVGQAVNIVTPSGYLGGEPVRVIYVGRVTDGRYQRLAGTVVLTKACELLSFVLLFSVCAGIVGLGYRESLARGSHTAAGVSLLALALGLLVLGLAVWVSLWKGARPLTAILSMVAALLPGIRSLRALRDRCRAMEDEVVRLFAEKPRETRQALGLLLATHGLMLSRPAVFFLLSAASALTLPEVCLVFVVGQAFFALQVTPSSVGTLDAGLLSVFALAGLSVPDGMAFLLCVRLWDAVTVAAAAWIAARSGIAWLGGHAARALPPTAAEESTLAVATGSRPESRRGRIRQHLPDGHPRRGGGS
jgi:uncharacterized protein (TIRG00374 family)